MKNTSAPIAGQQLYADEFLFRLRKVFHYLYPEGIREYKRDTVLFFYYRSGKVCLYNAYPDGVQLIFNRSLLSAHFDAVHEFVAPALPDWHLLAIMLTDILDKVDSGPQDRFWPLIVKRKPFQNLALRL